LIGGLVDRGFEIGVPEGHTGCSPSAGGGWRCGLKNLDTSQPWGAKLAKTTEMSSFFISSLSNPLILLNSAEANPLSDLQNGFSI
jgi:hypothetical protein